ncbi:MAG: hypothetical protein GC186_14985 [Rhodobacteraceae bacterium]|nr:hypothetical protein [Paracoccaceae bacterium]
MTDHRWLVSALIDMFEYAERSDLDEVARSLEAAIERISPIVGGTPDGSVADDRGNAVGQGRASASVIPFPAARQRRSA